MAHNLATIEGKIAMIYTGAAPWHSLGTRVPNCLSVEEALVKASLNWQVSTEGLFLADGAAVPGAKATIRDTDRQVLGVVGDKYNVIQNAEMFRPLQTALDHHGCSIESAGALGVGSRVWMLVALPSENGEVTTGDRVKAYALFSGSHDGSSKVTGRNTDIRVVCQNTMEAALRRDRAGLSIPHLASGPARVPEIGRYIESLMQAHERSLRVYRQLAETPVTLDQVITYTESLWPKPPKSEGEAVVAELLKSGEFRRTRADDAREAVLELLSVGRGHELAEGTAWGALNAVTEYVDHVSVNRRDGKPRSGGAQSALFGAGADVKARALDLALDMWLGSAASERVV